MATPEPERPEPGPIILLPPSEGKAPGGHGWGWAPDRGAFGTSLGDRRAAVVRALHDARGGDRRLLGVGGDHLERARQANRLLLGAPTLPAWRRYTGVVWEHLDAESLPALARRQIVVVSGLLGLVRGDDPVPEYRLKMAASLPATGRLSGWWREDLSAVLRRRCARRFVVDLLPGEHRAAVDPDVVERRGRGATVVLRDRNGASGGHGAKAAKGRLARHLLTADRPPLDALAEWADPDYAAEFTIW